MNKNTVIVLCILSVIVVFTYIESHIYEVIESNNTLIEQSYIQSLEDHATHKDFVRINEKTLCNKTRLFYRTK